jgi:hypothetical protein
VTAPTKLGAFALGLVLAFAVAFGVVEFRHGGKVRTAEFTAVAT